VELVRADHEELAVEHAAIAGLIARHFQLDPAAAEELLTEARTAVADAVSLREFTAPLHAELPYPEKLRIIAMLWDVAVEDRTLDKYEEYLVGKVAELLYVSRGDVVRLRYKALLQRSYPPKNCRWKRTEKRLVSLTGVASTVNTRVSSLATATSPM
jgi:uncharacterized tellurite resistance protein B-like protein